MFKIRRSLIHTSLCAVLHRALNLIQSGQFTYFTAGIS